MNKQITLPPAARGDSFRNTEKNCHLSLVIRHW